MSRVVFALIFLSVFACRLAALMPAELRLGRANHSFDHLGNIGGQAEAAAASGSTIIYATGLGSAAYSGLPAEKQFKKLCDDTAAYNRDAKARGIELSIGYLCATSIMKLDTFDKNWTDEFRAQFKTKPAEWRQLDRNGKPLVSWYGGDYQPACMSNPDWRAYQRAMVRKSLETGHDGIFFDNPTVHPHGCYCPHCMKAFAEFMNDSRPDVEGIRKLADSHPKEFMKFRSTIARDFLDDVRKYARTIKPNALITCNNSLNAPVAFFSQCRTYGYNIHEMSKVEDFVVVEDQNTQPRTEANGQMFEYGPIYKMLHAISHHKPVVAVTIAAGDYHTAPNLMRLAMAEAAANNASYLSWPTWPAEQRARMVEDVRPQSDFMRKSEQLLNEAPLRADVILFMPFQRWIDTGNCSALAVADALTKNQIQYRVVCEDELAAATANDQSHVLLLTSRAELTPDEKAAAAGFEKAGGRVVAGNEADWMTKLKKAIGNRSVEIEGPPTVRAVVHDQPNRTIVHVYNLNVRRLSSFEDKVTPAQHVVLDVKVPFKDVGEVKIETADESAKFAPLKYQILPSAEGSKVMISVPPVDISSILVITAAR